MEAISSFLALLVFALFALDVLVIALFVYVVRNAWAARPDILGAPSSASQEAGATKRFEAVRAAWAEIEEGAARGIEGKRLAVINADRLVDRLLKDAGYPGEGALDRMRAIPRERVATAGDLISAHRFRNRVVHEVGFVPDDRALDTAIAQFRAFLSEVGYL